MSSSPDTEEAPGCKQHGMIPFFSRFCSLVSPAKLEVVRLEISPWAIQNKNKIFWKSTRKVLPLGNRSKVSPISKKRRSQHAFFSFSRLRRSPSTSRWTALLLTVQRSPGGGSHKGANILLVRWYTDCCVNPQFMLC